jgi:hypothetical protein
VKLGAENKKQLIVMALLLAIGAGVVIYDFSGTENASSAAPPATSPAARPNTQVAQNNLDPRVRLDILDASRKVKYEAGRNIFEMQALPTPTPIAPVKMTPTPYVAPTPPPPPPIAVKFYGFANKPEEPKKVFLAAGEGTSQTIFVAQQGDIIDRKYRVVQIQPNSVLIEDVLHNNKQSIPLTAK